MKKLLIIILLFSLVILPAYAAEEQAADTTSSEDAVETEDSEELEAPMAPPMSAIIPGEETESGSVGKGALLSPLLSESFQTDLATGAATVSVPIVVPPGRKNMQPNLALSYSSNNSNGVCGVGWALTTSSIQRSTKNGTPKYDDTDTFVFASSGSSGELVSINDEKTEYRQKIETAFMKYVLSNNVWTVYDKNGTKYTFGNSIGSQITDPADNTKIFAWFLDRVEDVHGNYVTYIYEKPDDGQIYLKETNYTGGPGLAPDKSVVFNYEDDREDKLYNYRSGWEIETSKRLKEVRINVDSSLTWKYVLDYKKSIDTDRSLLSQITLYDGDGEEANFLPPKRFAYQTIE